MKALIPVAGAGKRLRPHTYTQPKPLIAVAGKPIISFIVDQLLAVGIREFVFVIGYLGEKIQAYITEKYPDIQVTFVQQIQREGLGHAVWTARNEIIDCDELFIVLGDTIFDADLQLILEQPRSALGIKKVEDPREFGVAELDDSGKVRKVIEKPKIPKSNMALVGLYKIKEVRNLIDALQYNIDNNIRTNDEFHLTDALMRMIEQGVSFTPIPVSNWFDCGRKDILIDTNAMLLKRFGVQPIDNRLYPNTVFIHPISVGENCEISNAILGPNLTIGNHAIIRNAIVKDSIIGDYSQIENIVLQKSVVGSDTRIQGLNQSLNIGDNAEIDFSQTGK